MKTPNTKKPRHPNFDEAWIKYQRILYWAAIKVSKLFGGDAEDYWAILLIRFNTALWGWNKNKGEFSTYFMTRVFSYVFRIIKTDSDRLSAKYRKSGVRDDNFKAKVLYRLRLNNIAHKDRRDYYSWPTDFLLELGEASSLSNYMLSKLDGRQQYIVKKRIYEKLSLEAIGNILELTRERIRQLESLAIERIRRVMFYDKKFRKLMNEHGVRLPEYCYRLYDGVYGSKLD
jgi:RNA polymerase sigma factor (sigma-70 family)